MKIVICNYNLATKLNFRHPISLVFTLWRRNLIFVAQCNECSEYGAKNVSLLFFFFFFCYDLGNENQFVAQCNLYLQFGDETSFSLPNVIDVVNLAFKNFNLPLFFIRLR